MSSLGRMMQHRSLTVELFDVLPLTTTTQRTLKRQIHLFIPIKMGSRIPPRPREELSAKEQEDYDTFSCVKPHSLATPTTDLI